MVAVGGKSRWHDSHYDGRGSGGFWCLGLAVFEYEHCEENIERKTYKDDTYNLVEDVEYFV